jgi:succinoglycan biosynthesis transport protein ExoP
MEDFSSDIRRYASILLRWSWLILLCAAIAAFVSNYYSSHRVPLYRATATLLVQPSSTTSLSDYNTSVLLGQRLSQTYLQMLKGEPIMESVIKDLGLNVRPEVLASRVSVSLVRDTLLLRLSLVDTDPQQAAILVNAMAEAFITLNQAMQEQRFTDALAEYQIQMDDMSKQIDDLQVKIEALGNDTSAEGQAEISLLQTRLAGYQNAYAIIVRDYSQLRMSAAKEGDALAFFERAKIPRAPFNSSKRTSTILAAIVGALFAIGIAFLVEYLDDTIKTPEIANRALGLTTLGTLLRVSKNGDLITDTQPLSPAAEAYRKLRTNIRFTSLDKPLRSLLVTSAGPGEGKSTVVANLALVMAQSGLKVVVLDGDLRRPRQHRIFGLSSGAGLSGSLLDGNLDGNVRPVKQFENLFVLPSGDIPPNPAEMLGSKRMKELLDRLTTHVDVVVVDSPPILPVTDAAVLSQTVDGVLLVLDAGHTRRGMAHQAAESIRQVGGNLVGVVLNRASMRNAGYSYYYEYYGNGTHSHKKSNRLFPNPIKYIMSKLDRKKAKMEK